MSDANRTGSTSGIAVAASMLTDTDAALTDILTKLGAGPFQHLIVLFSIEHDAETVIERLTSAYPNVPVSGCSTAGEIGPGGMMQGGIVIMAFPFAGFHVHAEVITDLDYNGVERATAIVRPLKSRVIDSASRNANRVFALMLIDGLSNREEAIVAAVHWAMSDVPLIGGSAGDSLMFAHTQLIYHGKPLRNAALIFMIECPVPFRAFKTQNFEPTPIKLVVTEADTENRIVRELNAEPAAREYAAAIGLRPDELGPFSFASYPLVVKVGGDYYCRSIRNMNPDGSLSFFCAIDEGLVLTVARPQDIVQSTADALAAIDRDLGGIDFVLGFDCILRRLDAETRQVRHQVDEVYKRYGVIGFQTYGEQFNGMHLNQTLTGIAFGKRPLPPEHA